jgi:hypothetical protein
MYTDVLDRSQLLGVISQLAGLLSGFYDADPFTDKGQQMVDELTHWLDRDRED